LWYDILIDQVSIDFIVDMDSILFSHPVRREDDYGLRFDLLGDFFTNLLKDWIYRVFCVILNIGLQVC